MIILLSSCLLTRELKENYIFSVKTISNEKYNEIIKGKTETIFQDVEITLNNETIAKLENNNYYIVQKNDEKYEGNLSNKGNKYKLRILENDDSKLDLIKNGEPLKLIIYNENNYEVRNIYMTYIPIIEISESEWAEYREKDKELYTGYINLYSYLDDNTYQKEKYFSLYHRRGTSTLSSTKYSYSVDLLDDNWNNKKVSLLGMREDDDWNLLSMGTDASMIKEKLSMDIWTYLSKYSAECRYVELIKDGQYMGLYLLTEPVDRKTLGGNKNDLLVKLNDWYSDKIYGDTDITHIRCIKADKCILTDVTIKNLTIDNSTEIGRITNELHNLYKGLDSNLFEFDYQNCVDYSLYLQLTMATDNTYKNERLLLVKDGGKYRTIKGAWDFDLNFNIDNINNNYLDYILPLEYKNSKEYNKDVAKLYESIKSYYNIDNLLNIIDEYTSYISNSGALTRLVKNSYYIGSSDYDTSLDELKETIVKRVEYLDNYYSNILMED